MFLEAEGDHKDGVHLPPFPESRSVPGPLLFLKPGPQVKALGQANRLFHRKAEVCFSLLSVLCCRVVVYQEWALTVTVW